MTTTDTATPGTEISGPIDFLLLEFPKDRLTGAAGRELVDLVERGVIRLYDLIVISKEDDGSISVLEVTDPLSESAGFSYFAGARSGLLGNDDVAEAAQAMQPGTVAALIVYENSWAARFVAAARDSGGEVIASARIPATEVMAALEALEPTS